MKQEIYVSLVITFAKGAKSDGRMSICGMEEILRASGAIEKSNGTLSAGGYRG